MANPVTKNGMTENAMTENGTMENRTMENGMSEIVSLKLHDSEKRHIGMPTTALEVISTETIIEQSPFKSNSVFRSIVTALETEVLFGITNNKTSYSTC